MTIPPDEPAPSMGHPRICICVIMNHPFPANLPLLRKIYAGRFSVLRFIMPFERLADEDVITVYRGSYAHAAFLTDARPTLMDIACNYYLVVHDDVLLNPALSEETFFDFFPIGPDDGVIPRVRPIPDDVANDIWWFGMLPKLLHPKSILFGSGIEQQTVLKYLPDADRLRTAMNAAGIVPLETTRIRPDTIDRQTFGHPPSRILLHGLGVPLDDAAGAQRAIEGHGVETARSLATMLLETQRFDNASPVGATDDVVPVPLPLVDGRYFTDFYILPRSGLDDFCHYAGVAGAANLFVEIMAPTLLYAACARVWTGDDLGLDFSGFEEPKTLDWFEDRRHAAVHPFKLSAFRTDRDQGQLLDLLRGLAAGRAIPGDAMLKAGFGSVLAAYLGLGPGWQPRESWGMWAAQRLVTIPILLPGPRIVRLRLLAALNPATPLLTGKLVYNGRELPFAVPGPDPTISFLVRLTPDADGVGRIEMISDHLLRPSDLAEHALDSRYLGFAFLEIEEAADGLAGATGDGWFDQEDWGVWAGSHVADLHVPLAAPGPVSLRVTAPLLHQLPDRTGELRCGNDIRAIIFGPDKEMELTVTFDHVIPDADGFARLSLRSDQLICPRDHHPAMDDTRHIGLGLMGARRVLIG